MSVMQKLMEFNDELVRVRAELDALRREQSKVQRICVDGVRRITELMDELDATRKQLQNVLFEQEDISSVESQPDFGVERMPKKNKPESQLVKEILSAMDQEEADDAPTEPKKPKKPVKTPAGQNDLIRDVSHYIEAAEVDRPTEPQFKPYTFAAYIVGDRIQPDALRIVWATEEWIQHSQFGIVHRMKDMQFSGNDTFTPDQFSVNLRIQ